MSQKLTRRQFMVLSGASMTALALNSCASTPASSEPQQGGILRIGFIDRPADLNPWSDVFFAGYILKVAIYESLVVYDADLKIQPALATHWEASPDGLTWTFKLRSGVTFHDGSPFTADDVVYSFTEILKPDNGFIGGKTIEYVDKVTATAADTVQFTLKEASIDFPISLGDSLSCLFVVPHTKTIQELIDKPIGTGPFKMKEYVVGSSARLVRHESYWDKGLPYLDELHHLYLLDMATQVAALTSGELDMMYQINPESVAVLAKTPHLNVAEIPHSYAVPILMSVNQKPFHDVRVRQAMKYLTNRKDFIQAALQEYGQIGNDQPILTGVTFAADLPPYPFDIAKAKALLTEAGYPNGFETTLVTSDAFPRMVVSAVVFQKMAKQAGVTVNVKQLPIDNYWTEYLTYPMAISSWITPPSADQALSLGYLSSSYFNETGLHDKMLDSLVQAARGEADNAKRQELYTQIQQKIQTEGGVIIPYFASMLYAHHEKVQGIIYSPNSITRANTAWLKQS